MVEKRSEILAKEAAQLQEIIAQLGDMGRKRYQIDIENAQVSLTLALGNYKAWIGTAVLNEMN